MKAQFIERWECPDCGMPAETKLFPIAVRDHVKGCSAGRKPARVRYYREDRAEKAEAAARDLARWLEEIARRPSVERNPDGEDQAAATMKLIASEALARYPEYVPSVPERAPWLSVDDVALAWQSPSKLYSRLPSEHSLDQEEDR